MKQMLEMYFKFTVMVCMNYQKIHNTIALIILFPIYMISLLLICIFGYLLAFIAKIYYGNKLYNEIMGEIINRNIMTIMKESK